MSPLYNPPATISPTVRPLDAGSALFADASGYITEDNANLFYDDTNDRLHVGPRALLASLGLSSISAYQDAGIAYTGSVRTPSSTVGTILTGQFDLTVALTDSFVPRFFRINVRDSGGTNREVLRHSIGRVGADDSYSYNIQTMAAGSLTNRIVIDETGRVVFTFATTAARGVIFGNNNDVALFRGAANRLDLDSGDSLNLVSGTILVAATKVIGAQGAAVADASGGLNIDVEARTQLNALLACLRASTGHGLIA